MKITQNTFYKQTIVLFITLFVFFVLPFMHSFSLVQPDPLMAAEETIEDDVSEGETHEAAYLPAPQLKKGDYPRFWGINSRLVIWFVAQLHLLFGAFVLAVPIFVFVIELIGVLKKDERYDRISYEFIKVSITAYSLTAILGGFFLFALVIFYPDLFGYLARLFGPPMLLYALLFLGESVALYIYYYAWGAMRFGDKKLVHLLIGFLLNLFGIALLVIANSLTGFMMAPSGVDTAGIFQGSLWDVINNPFWHPLNLHRLITNIAFGGTIVAAYAAYRFLSAKRMEEKAYYDWMGYTANFIAIVALLPLPLTGYYFASTMYAYSQQMGVNLMGGIFSWMFIIQAVLIGIIILSANYYLWCGMTRVKGAEKYKGYVKYIATAIIASFLVLFTPHTLIVTPQELQALNGASHPYLHLFGVMPAKLTAINIIIIGTYLSLMIYRRSNRVPVVSWARYGNAAIAAFLFVGIVIIITLGVASYLVPTTVRMDQAIPQVFTTVSVIIFSIVIDSFLYKGATPLGPIQWGNMPPRSQYALFLFAISFTWLMSLMGYLRSAIRQHWHVYTVMRDNSQDAFTPTIGYATDMTTIITIIFLAMVVFIFWLNQMSSRKA